MVTPSPAATPAAPDKDSMAPSVMPWGLVFAGCIGMFAATATGSTRAPFLPDMAADLGSTLPAVANLFGVTAASWGFASWLAGWLSDRVGRTVFLLGAPIGIVLAMVLISQAQSYPALFLFVIFGGLCCGSYTTSVLAEVSLRAPESYHGRAFGYVMSGQSLTLLFGVPVAAWLGASLGWRGVHLVLAVLSIVSFAIMLAALFGGARRTTTRHSLPAHKKAPFREALSSPIQRLFLALIAERISFGLAAFYYPSYLRGAYNLEIDAVALPLVGFALGNIVGTLVGGQVSDRFPYRRISFAFSLASAGLIALPWFLWQGGLAVTVTLGIVFAFFNALGRPSLLAALAEVPSHVRGTVMGLNSSVASIGWLVAALVGGWFYASVGFGGFGPLMAAMCVISALVVVPDSRIRLRR